MNRKKIGKSWELNFYWKSCSFKKIPKWHCMTLNIVKKVSSYVDFLVSNFWKSVTKHFFSSKIYMLSKFVIKFRKKLRNWFFSAGSRVLLLNSKMTLHDTKNFNRRFFQIQIFVRVSRNIFSVLNWFYLTKKFSTFQICQ